MHRLLLLDITSLSMHPSDDLFQGKHVPVPRPVCDHYAGSEKRMRQPLTPDLPMPAWIETHAAMHEIRRTPTPGEVARPPLRVVDSARAHRSAIHDTAIKSPEALRHAHAVHAKMKIAAACHASGRIASHNGRSDIHDPLAVAFDAIKAAESRLSQYTSTLHDCAGYRYDGAVLRRAKRSGQSLPEAAGALM
jgi:citrate lyase subunit beta/citryl-CoA lyase